MAVQKKDNIIGPFIGAAYPLNPYAESQFVGRIFGRLFMFPTVQHAMIACSTDATGTISMLTHSWADPRLAKSYGRNHGLSHDSVRVDDLFGLLLDMYHGPILNNGLSYDTSTDYRYVATSTVSRYVATGIPMICLRGTNNEDIVYFNYWHDNYLGVCCCERCRSRAMPGLNLYGIMLMVIRGMDDLGTLDPYCETNRPMLPEETVFSASYTERTWEQVRNNG